MTTTAATPPASAASGTTVFLGRQPIFDRHRNVFGYELLHRSNAQQNSYVHGDGDQASKRVINGSLNVVGMSELVGNHKAFINITRKLLINEDYAVLPRETAVIELLETVEPDDEVVNACKALKDAGYLLALDDFVFEPKYEPLLEMADILKIDFLISTPEQRKSIPQKFGGGLSLMLAEKVETHDDFQQALDLGYTYFQGYFFCKPEIISQKDIPALKQHCLRFLKEVNAPQIDFASVEDVVKRDMSLSTKLLRYLNSAAVGMPNRISSIRQALTLMGQKPLQKWASLVALAAMGEDKPTELMTTALVRARFCEQLGTHIGLKDRELDLFLMGLFSALDALMDQPMGELVTHMPLPHDVSAALLGANSLLGKVYGLILAYERSMARRVETLAASLKVTNEDLTRIYREAVVWADESLIV